MVNILEFFDHTFPNLKYKYNDKIQLVFQAYLNRRWFIRWDVHLPSLTSFGKINVAYSFSLIICR